ncbi:MAG: GIY-YIG nuclease family protein [Bacteroidota bacterium]
MVFFVYILQSEVNESFYKGSTNDLMRRFIEHNERREDSTRRYAPWRLIHHSMSVAPNNAKPYDEL